MSYCINPQCQQPDRHDNQGIYCNSCGTGLVLNGRYRVQRDLTGKEAAASGFGRVYEILEGSQPKILKVLLYHHNNNPKAIELFQQEAQVLQQFNNTGIPKIDGYFKHQTKTGMPLHCLVMEKIDGVTLEQWMRQQGNEPISDKKALDWLEEIVKILALVHSQNYFHRDIKPANIMLRRTGQLVLIDFGTAREMTGSYLQKQGEARITRISSEGYTPPEQSQGQAVPQSDFFALGRTLVQLLTAREPRDMYVAVQDEFIWRKYTQNASPELLDLIDKMMARRPIDRHQNTSEILREISKVRKIVEKRKTKVKVNPNPSSGMRRRDVLLLLGGSSALAVIAWENFIKPKPKITTTTSPSPILEIFRPVTTPTENTSLPTASAKPKVSDSPNASASPSVSTSPSAKPTETASPSITNNLDKIAGEYKVILDPKFLADAEKDGVKSVTGRWTIKPEGTFEATLKAVSTKGEEQEIKTAGKITIKDGKVVSQVETVNGEKPPQAPPEQPYTLSADGKELQADGQPVKLVIIRRW